MTNAEKFLKEGVSIEEFAYAYAHVEQEALNGIHPCNIKHFLQQPVQPTLTEDERVILRNVKWKGYTATHIGRAKENKGSFIYIRFENDIEMTYYFDNFFGHLFQFIKERRRIFNRGVIK